MVKKSKLKLIGITLGAILAAFVVGFMVWYTLNLRPVGTGEAASFTIKKGQSAGSIAKELQKAKLIRSAAAFNIYITVQGVRGALQAGAYTLTPTQSTRTVAGILSRGQITTNQLVVPEGTTAAKISELVSKKGITKAQFEAALEEKYDYDFLAARPAGAPLEGYLFPDSYQLGKETTATQLVESMLENFNRKQKQISKEKLAAQNLTLHQAITLASIVEEEAITTEDRKIVAQVFLKRLRIGMAMQSDVTVDYAASLKGTTFNLSLDSPYNTYKYAGLPLGPICNPGLDSIQAVLSPASTDYLYFISDKSQKMHYAFTQAEHDHNVAKYLR